MKAELLKQLEKHVKHDLRYESLPDGAPFREVVEEISFAAVTRGVNGTRLPADQHRIPSKEELTCLADAFFSKINNYREKKVIDSKTTNNVVVTDHNSSVFMEDNGRYTRYKSDRKYHGRASDDT